jgi:ribosomal protein L11 methylase PrmA
MENLRLNGLLDAGEDVLEPTTAMAILANHELLRLHLGPLTPLPGSPGLEVLPPPWSGPFDLILCNMLQHEFTPLLKSFPRLLDRDGVAILSGFLVRDWEELLADLETAELMPVGALEEQGEWGGIVVAPRR